MLQALRNRIHGWPATIVLGVAVLAMSLFGVQSYLTSRGETWVAKVGDHEISQQELQQRLNDLRRQGSEQYGAQFDPTIYDQPAVKETILNQMVDRQLLLDADNDMKMKVADQALRDTIAAAFQVDGQFDAPTYQAYLAQKGQSVPAFEQEVRSDLAVRLIPGAIAASALVTDQDVRRYLALAMQQRDIHYAVLPVPTLSDAQAAVSDAEVKAYYTAHPADFTTPEQVQLAYIEVKAADVTPDAPTDEELRQRYAQEKQRFVKPEQREASHILIDVPKNATAAQQKAALAKAEKVAAEATPANFAKLAKTWSQDLGSKSQGGDLGWIEPGVTNKAFEDALFSMQKGQISKPVLSDEGYHVIWLRDVRQGDVKSFDEVKPQLEKEAAENGRKVKYNQVAGKLADQAYQNPNSLEPAAQALDLPIQHTGLFGHDGGQGLAADPQVIKAAFSEDVLGQGNNSGLIKLGDDRSVVVRVEKHQPAALQPLSGKDGAILPAMRERIAKDIRDQRLAAEATKRADALLQDLRKGTDLASVAGKANADIKQASGLQRQGGPVPPAVLKQAFLLPHPAGDKPTYGMAELGDGKVALIALDKVTPGDASKLPEQQRTALRQSMVKAFGSAETEAFIKALRQKARIQLAPERM